MDPSDRVLEPDEAIRRFTQMLDEAGLPHFEHVSVDDAQFINFGWPHGLTICQDLTEGLDPLDEWDRSAILGGPMCECGGEPISVYVPGSSDDPRAAPEIPGVEVRRGPRLHPDDRTVLHGIPCTSLSRTLIDCAEVMQKDELRQLFTTALGKGLERDALVASRGRVEWRPSLAMFDEVFAEFFD